ncbi:MAG: 2-dehydro-3-deoxygalactonokinase [Deinococcus sp.]
MTHSPGLSPTYALIDSGTTRSRVRLWRAGVIWEESLPVGAAAVAREGREVLRAGLESLLARTREQAALKGVSLDAVIASGMVSSNVGLHEVPHLPAPLSFAELAAGTVPQDIPGLGLVHFIPGLRTSPDPGAADPLAGLDVLRGEEVEVCGLRELLDLRGPADFIHYGSHHKRVRTDEWGVLGSLTTLGGELLAATIGHTVLASSAVPPAELGPPDEDWWSRGWRAAENQGYARAAFCARLADVRLGASPGQVTSYLLGAVAQQDASLLAGDAPLVLYGHATFTGPVGAWLARQGRAVRVVDGPTGELAAPLGAVRLFEMSPYR